MADNDVVVDEIGAEEIQTDSKPIEDLLDAIQSQNFETAEKHFNDIVGDRLQDTLDQAKMKIASSIYGDEAVADAEEEVYGDELSDDDADVEVDADE